MSRAGLFAALVWLVAANSLVNEAYFDDLEGLVHHNLHAPFFPGSVFFAVSTRHALVCV